MSATTMDDRDALAAVRTLARRLVDRGSIGPAGDARSMLDDALQAGVPTPGPSFRDWARAHDGAVLDTLQVTGHGAGGWMPLGRVLDAHTWAGHCLLDGSRRDYVGVRVISATPRALLAADGDTVILYRVSP